MARLAESRAGPDTKGTSLNGTDITLVVLEIVLSVGALAGSIPALIDPTGSSQGVSLALLEGTPFDDFFVPALALFLLVGLWPWMGALGTLLGRPWARSAHVVTGLLLVGWIVAQVAYIGAQTWLQPFFLLYGLLILGLGIYDRKPLGPGPRESWDLPQDH